MSELPKLLDILKKSTKFLVDKGIENAKRESEWIFAHFLELDRIELYTNYDALLDAEQLSVLREAVQKRSKRVPLAYILGTQPFMGLEFFVSKAVLVPRIETEELVEKVLKDIDENNYDSLLDIGTGSGAIAVSVKNERKGLSVFASDISDDALLVANKNAEKHDADISFTKDDLATNQERKFDIITANLPYIAYDEKPVCDKELDYEPQIALFAEDDGLELIKKLLLDLPRILNDNGIAYFEHGFKQGDRIKIFAENNDLFCEIIKDEFGNDRIAKVSIKG